MDSDHGAADGAQAAAKYVEEEEGVAHRLPGVLGHVITSFAVIMSIFHLYAAYAIVPANVLRAVHVGFVLALSFLSFPIVARWRDRLAWWDWLPAAVSVAVIAYILAGGDAFADRATVPTSADIIVGVVLIVLVLEAVRRASGWIMPAVVVVFIAYAMFGSYLPPPWTHRGYDVSRLVGHMVMTLEGIFGTAVDVSSTLIILFTLFGAVLSHSGAGKFFIDFSVAALGGKRNGAGRSVVLASFLLGGPSGSGVATTVTLGSVACPMLAKAGYGKDAAGGLLAAGGLGAILSPPVLGAAAFLIAEFLKISYLDVVLMAVIPTCLYYLSLFLMVEFDGRKFGSTYVAVAKRGDVMALLRSGGHYFLPLVAIVALLLAGFSPVMSVFWATVVAFVMSFRHRASALMPRKFIAALAAGSTGVLSVAATCAAAGIIVGVVTLTGLGLKFSAIVVGYAGGSLFLTAVFTALVVWVVGLAVPVTASYITCAVIASPALIHMGVPDFAAHMFVFYCGGYHWWRSLSNYAAIVEICPARLSHSLHVCARSSWRGLLLKGSFGDTVLNVVTALIGIAALAGGVQNWFLRQTSRTERAMLIAAGLLLVYPGPVADGIGLALVIGVVAMQKLRKL